ncbi:pyridoxine/pyridoxal/pyridoxamine kinase [Luteimonas saliphila]|uniref:pyridoxine/pyridoxal/pyridoxamine kinase n=1 Tax=Luteimonas saliphila TaxID=2804919 RepID=UPI00192D81A1|nr:pyridoxine/pyridoxal/pyridoxamine kinase [Luteimonas saliphila]
MPSAGTRLVDVISIQSQVAYGGVGNAIAVPVLQALGLQVAPVPTVVLGNTPHYPTMHGGALPQDWFEGLLDDLEARDVASRARMLLVGYLGSPQQGLALARWLDRVHERNPKLAVHIDPVIGDHDTGSYTDPALVPVWRDHLLPRAEGLTPNHYELEQLGGRRLRSLDDCVEVAAGLLSDTTHWVVVTSAAPETCPPGTLQLVAVSADGCETFEHPLVRHAVKGVGDMFAALVGGRMVDGASLSEAVRRACDDVVAVLRHVQAQGWQELALPRAIARAFD